MPKRKGRKPFTKKTTKKKAKREGFSQAAAWNPPSSHGGRGPHNVIWIPTIRVLGSYNDDESIF
jgi:hypothetical protein